MALINEYPPGAPIGWHRDAPQYDIVVGMSLLSPCRMRLRPYVRAGRAGAAPRPPANGDARARAGAAVDLPDSSGPARSAFEHSIPAVDALRYSITFRIAARGQRARVDPGIVPGCSLASTGRRRPVDMSRRPHRRDPRPRRVPGAPSTTRRRTTPITPRSTRAAPGDGLRPGADDPSLPSLSRTAAPSTSR